MKERELALDSGLWSDITTGRRFPESFAFGHFDAFDLVVA